MAFALPLLSKKGARTKPFEGMGYLSCACCTVSLPGLDIGPTGCAIFSRVRDSATLFFIIENTSRKLRRQAVLTPAKVIFHRPQAPGAIERKNVTL